MEAIVIKNDSDINYQVLKIDRIEVIENCFIRLHSGNRNISIGRGVDFIGTGIGSNDGTLILRDSFATHCKIKNYNDMKKYLIEYLEIINTHCE